MRLIFLLLLWSTLHNACAETINLTKNNLHHNLSQEGVIIPDPSKSLSYLDILKYPTVHSLSTVKKLDPNGKRYWIRATVKNIDAPEALNLRVPTTTLSYVHFRIIKKGRVVDESLQGKIPWSQEPISDIYPSSNMPLQLAPGEMATIIIRCEATRFNRHMPVLLSPAREAIAGNIAKSSFIVLVIGMSIILALYNAIIGVTIKRIAYIWYAIHALSYATAFLFRYGYMAKLFSIPDINFHYYQLTVSTFQLAALLFTYHFFNLNTLLPGLAKFYRILVGVITTQLVISLLFDLYTPYNIIAVQQFLHGPLIFITAVIALRRGFTAAWFVMFGWFFITLSLAWAFLATLGLVPSLSVVRETILASVWLDMVLLSLAMAYQFRRLEKEQMEMRKNEEIQNRFLATLSHEVRTPLSSIISLVSRVIERLDKRPERETLEEVKYSGDALLSMVDNLLLFTQAKSNVVHPQQNFFEPRILFRSVVTLFTERSQSNHVTVRTEISPQVPERLLGDDVLLRQIIINLLGNAIKHTHDGRVTITVTPFNSPPDRCKLGISIKDTGEGIPEGEQKRIFDQFYQVKKSADNTGAGIGLYIVSELIKVLDGKIELNSSEGEGTTITLTLPFLYAPDTVQTLPATAHSSALAGTSLLLVEDDPTLSNMITEMLLPYGMDIIAASTAREALQQLDTCVPNFILTDLHLPDLSGIPLVQKFCQRIEQTGMPLPLIIMTASTNHELHAELADLPIAETLIKPVASHSLLKILLAHRPRPDSHSHSSPPYFSPSQSLDHELVSAHIESMGFESLASLLAQYNESSLEYLQELGAAINERNKEQIVYLGHKISGLAAMLGLAGVSSLAKQFENNIDNLDDEMLIVLHNRLASTNQTAITELTSCYLDTAIKATS